MPGAARRTFFEFEWNNATGLLRVGVSFALIDFNARLSALGLFVPHGQCSHVRLGGHFQTGGYGQLARSFGLFGDHVVGFEIIMADGVRRTVMRDSPETAAADGSAVSDRDLFFAVLGGSPGNFGVITHLHLRPLRDKDYPSSRGLKILLHYSRDVVEKLLVLLSEMIDDPDYSGDYDFSITVLSGNKIWSYSPDYDEMRLKYPAEFGTDELPALIRAPQLILVYLQYSGRTATRAFDPTLFTNVKKICGYYFTFHEVTDAAHTPMSNLTGAWLFLDVREFDLAGPRDELGQGARTRVGQVGRRPY